MTIHLDCLHKLRSDGIWGTAWAAQCATNGDQVALFDSQYNRIGWIGKE